MNSLIFNISFMVAPPLWLSNIMMSHAARDSNMDPTGIWTCKQLSGFELVDGNRTWDKLRSCTHKVISKSTQVRPGGESNMGPMSVGSSSARSISTHVTFIINLWIKLWLGVPTGSLMTMPPTVISLVNQCLIYHLTPIQVAWRPGIIICDISMTQGCHFI